ncbi:FkbM family methyltransferase [Lysobacter cavernae]|uniref:FkbM family methyltransferase n=1 Tax=Lysobacter cavernae TaxID=1685901 RepID=A0ABV7RMF8_9GAMM
MTLLKTFAAQLPSNWQHELKKLNYGRQIRRNRFFTTEPEFALVDSIIQPGDWVIDVGANVGHYTKRFSELAGPGGRVIAFEPVPTTFALLAANVRLFANNNVTLLNAAASNTTATVGMAIPHFDSGLTNYYEAHLSALDDGALAVLALPIDALGIEHRVALVKVDAEGHDAVVLDGMQRLLARDHPVLIVETASDDVIASLTRLGYGWQRLPDSPNLVFRANPHGMPRPA